MKLPSGVKSCHGKRREERKKQLKKKRKEKKRKRTIAEVELMDTIEWDESSSQSETRSMKKVEFYSIRGSAAQGSIVRRFCEQVWFGRICVVLPRRMLIEPWFLFPQCYLFSFKAQI